MHAHRTAVDPTTASPAQGEKLSRRDELVQWTNSSAVSPAKAGPSPARGARSQLPSRSAPHLSETPAAGGPGPAGLDPRLRGERGLRPLPGRATQHVCSAPQKKIPHALKALARNPAYPSRSPSPPSHPERLYLRPDGGRPRSRPKLPGVRDKAGVAGAVWGTHESPQASLVPGGGPFDPSLFPDESNCAALPPGSETGGSGGFGYRPQHAEPITGYGAKAPGSASPWCVDGNSRSPYRERTADPGRVRHAHSLAQASTGTTHGAIPRAPLPHCRGTGLKHPGRRAPV